LTRIRRTQIVPLFRDSQYMAASSRGVVRSKMWGGNTRRAHSASL